MTSTTIMGPEDTDVVQPLSSPPQLNRSCESCRSLKVRCFPDPKAPDQCQRCAKAKRTCIFVAPQRRRPRKRTDSRVAQLEREMRQMRSLLKGRLHTDETSTASDDSEEAESIEGDVGANGRELNPNDPSNVSDSLRPMNLSPGVLSPLRRSTFDSRSISPASFDYALTEHSAEVPVREDVIDRGIISLEYANQLVALFNTELAACAGMILCPADATAAQLRHSKPILFLSVIAAAALAVDAGLAAILNREMVHLYAERFFINGEKSLELIQALLVMTIFYYPPDSPLKLQHCQYTHVASTMALELGLTSRHIRFDNKKGGKSNKRGYNEHVAEQARAMVGCYHLASRVAMKMRCPSILPFDDWMGEYVNYLECSPNVADRQTARWFELQKIVDESMASFGLDNASATMPLAETRIQAVLRWFDHRMQVWKNDAPAELISIPVTFEYHYTKLAVYEIAAGEGFRDPSAVDGPYDTLPPLETIKPASGRPLGALRVDFTFKWMSAAQEMLDYFLGCDTTVLQKLPNLVYTQVGLALISLLKVYFQVRTGALGEFITPQSVNIEAYLDALMRKLTDASCGGQYRVPSRWQDTVAVKACDWYEEFQRRHSQHEPKAVPQVSVSASTPPPALHIQPAAGFTTSHASHSSESLVLNTEAPIFPVVVGGPYGVPPPAMSPLWSPEQSEPPPFVHPEQFTEYPPQMVPPRFVYEHAPRSPLEENPHGPSGPSGPARAGIEFDGWMPHDRVYGVPCLPVI